MSTNNAESKLKYFTTPTSYQNIFTNYPTVTNNNSIIYGANGNMLNQNDHKMFDTVYTRDSDINKPSIDFDKVFFPSYINKGDPNDYSSKIDIETNFKISDHEKLNKIPTVKSSDGRTFDICQDRRRNLNHSSYIPGSLMVDKGFGNLNEFGKIKYGTSTRDELLTVRDHEYDRFHFTYRNYQNPIYGTNLPPQDTRYLNKTF